MTEAEVVAAFGRWLAADGWVVGPSTDRDLDIYATRAGQRLHVEAKGVTKDPYTSADIGWGQLLRRMSDLGQPGARYGVGRCPFPTGGRPAGDEHAGSAADHEPTRNVGENAQGPVSSALPRLAPCR
jgi:hypothetical protein